MSDKRAVLEKAGVINRFRCELNPIYGQSVLKKLEICQPLSSCQHPRRRKQGLIISNTKTARRFNFGYSEVAKIVSAKLQSSSSAPHNPFSFLETTDALCDLIPTIDERLERLAPVLSRFVIFVPAVTAPRTQCKVFKPAQSRYMKGQYVENQMTKQLSEPCRLIHPIVSCMSTQFPDPRLIQYDCGKLQTLDRLLRQLKAGSHRALIFTQMARMLDVLEAFLNYHGYIYLRLDGATRIDQRQLLMERFNTDKRIFCFILSTRSGGIGVNLTGADTVIFYDSDWNPTMDAQAQDRCHRIGQTRDVHIYRYGDISLSSIQAYMGSPDITDLIDLFE